MLSLQAHQRHSPFLSVCFLFLVLLFGSLLEYPSLCSYILCTFHIRSLKIFKFSKKSLKNSNISFTPKSGFDAYFVPQNILILYLFLFCLFLTIPYNLLLKALQKVLGNKNYSKYNCSVRFYANLAKISAMFNDCNSCR